MVVKWLNHSKHVIPSQNIDASSIDGGQNVKKYELNCSDPLPIAVRYRCYLLLACLKNMNWIELNLLQLQYDIDIIFCLAVQFKRLLSSVAVHNVYSTDNFADVITYSTLP